MKKGDIFLINFEPSFGSEYKKVRPGLILQSKEIESKLITVMPISSKIEKNHLDDIYIKKDASNRLFCNSLLKVSQISSFDVHRFLHFVGTMDSEIISEVDGYLIKHFELMGFSK